jgi:hypothetical protein
MARDTRLGRGVRLFRYVRHICRQAETDRGFQGFSPCRPTFLTQSAAGASIEVMTMKVSGSNDFLSPREQLSSLCDNHDRCSRAPGTLRGASRRGDARSSPRYDPAHGGKLGDEGGWPVASRGRCRRVPGATRAATPRSRGRGMGSARERRRSSVTYVSGRRSRSASSSR